MKLDILVPIHTYPDGNSDKLAQHVAAVAQHLEASIHAVVLLGDFPHVSSVLGNSLIDIPALISDAKAKCREHGSALLKAIETEMGPRDVSWRTTNTECIPAAVGDAVVALGRYHDLVLVGIGTDDATQATAESAIFGSGKPTLLVPEESPTASLGHVMIAWDGSRVAARAVSDARDFLQRAHSVTIASVTDEKALPDEDLGTRLAEYLSRHEIDAKVARVQSGGRPIAETLQEHARETGAGMLVMGGFGHSRMRDFVLGGATSGILKDLRLPVLFSH